MHSTDFFHRFRSLDTTQTVLKDLLWFVPQRTKTYHQACRKPPFYETLCYQEGQDDVQSLAVGESILCSEQLCGGSCVWVGVLRTCAPAAAYFLTRRLDWSQTGLTCVRGAAGQGQGNHGGGGVCNQEAEGEEAENSTATGGDLMNEACSSVRVPLSLFSAFAQLYQFLRYLQDNKRFIKDVMKTWDHSHTGDLQLPELQVRVALFWAIFLPFCAEQVLYLFR